MEIKGQLEDIIYTNEVNSYTVCNISCDNKLITAVGYLPFVNIGDIIIANGKFVVHNTYGEQFKIDTFEKVLPNSISEIEKYLGSGIIKGVGPVTSKKIVDKFKFQLENYEDEMPNAIMLSKELWGFISDEYTRNYYDNMLVEAYAWYSAEYL